MAHRLQAMGVAQYSKGFEVTLQRKSLDLPLSWKRPRIIFVNSMSDLFHREVSLPYIQEVFEVMRKANWHTFQVLTKRAERLAELDRHLEWSPNIWMGVSIESDQYTYRADLLKRTGACTKFLSCEPLLGPLPSLDLTGLDWVIVGGESGPGARPMEETWVTSVQDQCRRENVPFFFKQWGGVHKKKTGRILQGRTWDEFPQIHIGV